MSDLDLLLILVKKMTGVDFSDELPKDWNRHFVAVELQFEDGKFDSVVVY